MDMADFIESREECLNKLRNGHPFWQNNYRYLLEDLDKVAEFVDEDEGNTAIAAKDDIESSLTALASEIDDFKNIMDELNDTVEKSEGGMEQSLDDADPEVKECVIAVDEKKEIAENTEMVLSDEINSFSRLIAELMDKYEDRM